MESSDLRNAGLKVTLPRLKILEMLEHSPTRHMSAEDIYRQFLDGQDDIGLATVYRVITQLEGAGLLKRTQLDAHTTVYELNDKGHHDHLVCTDCGRILESSDPAVGQLVRKIAKRSGFLLDSYSLVLYGHCGCGKTAAALPHGEFE